MENKDNSLAKSMRWMARAIGLAVAGLFLLFLVGGAFLEGFDPASITIEGILLVVLVAIALVGCIISWWRVPLAGTVLVLASIGLGILIGTTAGPNQFQTWLAMGLPYLVAGGLFFYSWWLERKAD